MWRKSADDFPPSVQWRWTFDLESGAVTEQQIDDVGHGFPRVDDRRAGLPYRYGWVVSPRSTNGQRDLAAEAESVIVQYDLVSGARTEFDPGRGKVLGEPVFVPASDDAAEDEGWVMTYAHDRPSGVSSFIVFDSRDTSAPIAEVPLPQRVPYGFHGSWVAD
jgi:carotenoid cleavage dioxygenase